MAQYRRKICALWFAGEDTQKVKNELSSTTDFPRKKIASQKRLFAFSRAASHYSAKRRAKQKLLWLGFCKKANFFDFFPIFASLRKRRISLLSPAMLFLPLFCIFRADEIYVFLFSLLPTSLCAFYQLRRICTKGGRGEKPYAHES